MMVWKEIRKSGEIFDHATAIWRHEESLPKWFVASSRIWTGTEADFAEFIDECQEIHGLFGGDELLACVYADKQQSGNAITIHLSILAKIEPAVFIAEAAKLRNMFLHRGIRYIRGWTLRRNFALVRLMAGIGFRPTGFVMDHGSARGRVLRWELMQIKAG